MLKSMFQQPEPDLKLQVALVHRVSEAAYHLVLKQGQATAFLLMPKPLGRGQGIDYGQRDRVVTVPAWWYERYLMELKDV